MNLITPTSLRLLQLLFRDPMGRYHGREVVRRTGVSVGGANQMLRSFANLGLLLREKQGRMLFYRANMDNPLVRQLKILFTLFQLDDLIKQAKPFSHRIVLFGSSAEGTDVKESDIDLFVLGDTEGLVAGPFESILGREVQVFECKRVKDLDRYPAGFLKNIVRGNLLKGNLDFLKVTPND